MNPGTLKHRCEVQRKTETRDALGGVTVTWSTRFVRRVNIRPLSGRELTHAAQRQSQATHKITMRHCDDITPRDRFVHNDRVFNVESALNSGEGNVETVCMVVESV